MMTTLARGRLASIALWIGVCTCGWRPASADDATAPPSQVNDVSDDAQRSGSSTALDRALADLDQGAGSSDLDDALQALPADGGDPGDLFSRRVGEVQLRLLDLSVDLLFAVGGSSERDEALESLQGGGHDPRKRGFTLQNLEL